MIEAGAVAGIRAEPQMRSAICRSRAAAARLLLVALDDFLGAHLGGVGIAPELLERAPLPQQVPALVERDLHLGEPAPFGLARLTAGFGLPEAVLLLHEFVDRA